jgi:hypothetical protein
MRRLVLMAILGAYGAIVAGCDDDHLISGDPSTPGKGVAETAPAKPPLTLGHPSNGWVAVSFLSGRWKTRPAAVKTSHVRLVVHVVTVS